MEMVIDRANLDDIEGLINVYKTDGVKHARELDSYPLTEWILDSNTTFFVAKVSRKPIGFIFARRKGDEVKIDLFSVSKKYKGKGAETRLLERMEGFEDALKVTTYVPKSDKWAVSLFKKQGFIVYNEIKNLFGEGENGLYMVKDLTAPKIEKVRPRREKESKAQKAAKSYLEENLGKLDVYLEP